MSKKEREMGSVCLYQGMVASWWRTAADTDGKPRASGMWRVSAMATHPSTGSY